MSDVGFGAATEYIAPAAIGALDLADFGFHLQVNARMTQRAAAVAADVKRVCLDGFKRLSHGVCPRFFVALLCVAGRRISRTIGALSDRADAKPRGFPASSVVVYHCLVSGLQVTCQSDGVEERALRPRVV